MTSNSGATPKAVDLALAETHERNTNGVDYVEAKEALVDALLELTQRRCTGAGQVGEVVYGTRPSLKFVSGFLLPRYDRGGVDDETSDIRIATMGQDLQVVAGVPGTVVVEPRFSVYLRELPSWEEICDPRNDMMPQVQLSWEARRQIAERARTYIEERLAKLPSLPDDAEDPDRAGNDVVQAQQMKEATDIATESRESGEAVADADSAGHTKAAAEANERADRALRARADRVQEHKRTRTARREAIATIRRESFDRAYRELGIFLVSVESGDAGKKPLTTGDVAEETASNLAAGDTNPPPESKGPGDTTGHVRAGAGRIDDRFAAPQPIPYKWRRFELQLGSLSFDAVDRETRDAATKTFAERLRDELARVVGTWLGRPAGQRDAYRRNERILPSQFASKTAWEKYLADLRARRSAVANDVCPDLTGVTLLVDLAADFSDPGRNNLRIALENGSSDPSAQDPTACEHVLFQVELRVHLPTALHRPLRLDRIEASYRFKDWLDYPGMGLNCGVLRLESPAETMTLTTTWAPRYIQPRIDARAITGVPTSYAELSKPNTSITSLFALPDEYDLWIARHAGVDAGAGLPEPSATEERKAHARDLEAYRRESTFIRQGIALLKQAQDADRQSQVTGANATEKARLRCQAAPWLAWLHMNETFAQYGKGKFTDWRLFQLAFILAHIPTFASRLPEYSNSFDEFRDELSASLLYFPTGGGKSEAFFGVLIFNLFLDRLRGKARGVTALIRYPLRLLTLQQARRLTRILAQAELVRLRKKIQGFPFELGFWVGSGNTPNRVAQGFGGVPSITSPAFGDDAPLLNPPTDTSETAAAARRRSARYLEALDSYDKLRTCPVCGSPTGMRRYPEQHGRIGIVCFSSDCGWNKANPPSPTRVPLPFLLTDDTIYQRAPSVVLGTIDKLALIGQHDKTINLLAGMFGCARYIDPISGHLFVPRGQRALLRAEEAAWQRVRPAFSGGVEVFHDPFPSLVIQDEGHLLDESLGTFSGLFETTLEQIFSRLGKGVLKERVAMWPNNPARVRLAKVIAATATISDPDRQLRVLYQRASLRFPCPGPNLYESFYATPRAPLRSERARFAAALPKRDKDERASPRMRTYVSVMTNGRSHTMTTAAVVSAYHLELTRLWKLLVEEGRTSQFVAEIAAALPATDPLSPLRAQVLSTIGAASGGADRLATLLDLLRISLTYVTNKKGGDQIIETLQSQVEHDQRSIGISELPFTTELISGGVTVAEIQEVMRKAEDTSTPGQPFTDLGTSLRNIVATSAISHGVDVDKFNAMFFAGLPTDVSEYIQASSRVGRTHVGFSLLVPTPQSRRDRYVVETHDQFHRFLERMIAPPAVQRWAQAAIGRMIPSAFQALLCGIVEQEAFAAKGDDQKQSARTFTTAASIKSWADNYPRGGYPGCVRAVAEFVTAAIGLDGRSDAAIGAAVHGEHYKAFVEGRIRFLLDVFTRRADPSQLSNFWQSNQSRDFRKPMTSLRDVDAGGVIVASTRDPYRGKAVNLETIRQVMKVIRGQKTNSRSEVDADPAPVDTEDQT